MVTTRPPKTIVKPTALGPVANTDTKLLIYGLFQKGRVLAQDGDREARTGVAAGWGLPSTNRQNEMVAVIEIVRGAPSQVAFSVMAER